ncbi:WD40-repeat-containing domain protein [Tribonema minus]|uniref:WD40-repeat-containing domain protein n=1 Tax=Tribonema minus TaxID=303371 RepID=A0A835ZB86_9STRA|nr:WD40-repeat-containing domain protein [Tribonema minus]
MDDGAAARAGMSFVERPDIADDDSDDGDGDDAEDHVIQPSDAVLLAAATEEDEHAVLLVHVYDAAAGSLYVHHDVTLPALPLCVAWMDVAPRRHDGGSAAPLASYAAVGTFEPGIEIWNLDVLDPLEPSAVLGGWAPGTAGGAGAGGKKKKKGGAAAVVEGSHSDAVIGLSWNATHRQVLASAGADEVVKVWDVTTQMCSATLTHHSDKVQSVAWHATEAAVLASAAYDGKLAILDVRAAAAAALLPLGADPECLIWDPHDGSRLMAGTEDGAVACWDVRKVGAPPLFRFAAHGEGVAGLSASPHHRGLLATASEDKTVRLWDASAAGGAAMPVLLAAKPMAVGRLFAVSFYPGTPFLLATGGSKGQVALWHTDDEPAVAARFLRGEAPAGAAAASANVGSSSSSSAAAAPAAAAEKAALKKAQQEEDDRVVAAIEGMAVDDGEAKKQKKHAKDGSKKHKKKKGKSG